MQFSKTRLSKDFHVHLEPPEMEAVVRCVRVMGELAKDTNPATGEYLDWLNERLVMVYGESPNVDFVQRLKKIADVLNNRPTKT
jgi:hypothetical protein